MRSEPRWVRLFWAFLVWWNVGAFGASLIFDDGAWWWQSLYAAFMVFYRDAYAGTVDG